MTRLTTLARAPLAAGLERAWSLVARLVKIRDGERELPVDWDRERWNP